MRAVIISILSVCALYGQSEQALRSYFEGKTVRVKLDMPATKDGVDIRVRSAPPLDFKVYSQRIKNHGVSLRQGDSVAVTMVRLKGKNIEFQLGGGGYGVLGDDSGTVSLPAVPKSRREIDLEKDIKRETDSRRRDDMKRELSRLEERRRREDSARRAEEVRLTEIKKREIYEKAMRAGSRFNIWYPNNYLKEAVPMPQDVINALSEYVDFGAGGYQQQAPPPPMQPQYQQPAPAAGSGLKRGMTVDQVRDIYGAPTGSRDSVEGQLQVHSERFMTANDVIDVDFVEGVVIRYRISPR
jgi:hypothetical protein